MWRNWIKHILPSNCAMAAAASATIFDLAYSIRIAPRSDESRNVPWSADIAEPAHAASLNSINATGTLPCCVPFVCIRRRLKPGKLRGVGGVWFFCVYFFVLFFVYSFISNFGGDGDGSGGGVFDLFLIRFLFVRKHIHSRGAIIMLLCINVNKNAYIHWELVYQIGEMRLIWVYNCWF